MASSAPDRQARKSAPRWLARGCAVFGLLILVGAVVMGIALITSGWHTRAEERPVAGWASPTGIVVGVDNVADKNGYVYGPIVSFTDPTGTRYQFSAPTSSDEPTVGSPAVVSYDPRNPGRAHDLSDSKASWAAPFVTGIFILSVAGLAFLFVSWSLIHQLRRRARPGNAATAPAAVSPQALATVTWVPRLSTLPIAGIVYAAVKSSTHAWLTASIATAAYLGVALSLLTLVARNQPRRRADPAAERATG